MRDGLAVLIDGTQGYTCVGCYRSMEDALAGIVSTGRDVALVDICTPGTSGMSGIKGIKGISG